MNALQLRDWLNTLPQEFLENATVDGDLYGRPSMAKRVIAYKFKDGSGSGIVVNPMGSHMKESWGKVVDIVSVCDQH